MRAPEKVGDIRRMRVQYLNWHNPPLWAAYYEPPGSMACYCHATTLDEMWLSLKLYFEGRGYCQPLRIEKRFESVLR